MAIRSFARNGIRSAKCRCEGAVRNGVIVLDPPGQMREGTRVQILPESPSQAAFQIAKESLMR
ncbi:MAG: hypothetical protein KatS3mg105_3540 [Gemmatales bacterium]|nr:MAG: hypothetical protein KatS3mg105_3540 [Gemmatales bacterium]